MMNILIDENLRRLRQSRGNRQEDLANHLGVSVQSVSKWERGENLPDLTLIPAIASYYDVSVDDLLGVGEVRKQEKIDWYFTESKRLLHDGKTGENIALMRKAVKEFPNEHKLISQLAFALFFHIDRDREMCSEAIELDERILRESTDIYLRSNSIQRLSYSYHYLGSNEKAKEYAEMAGYMFNSREVLLSSVLEGEEGENHKKSLIVSSLMLILSTVNSLDSVDCLTRNEFCIKLLELFFDDGFMGGFASDAARYHYFTAVIYAGKGDPDKTRYHLESAVKCVGQLESLNGEYAYRSKILGGFKNDAGRYVTNCPISPGENLVKYLANNKDTFALYCDTEWFKAAVEELKSCTK